MYRLFFPVLDNKLIVESFHICLSHSEITICRILENHLSRSENQQVYFLADL